MSASASLGAPGPAAASAPASQPTASRPFGRSIEIDPHFGRYYRDRSPESIASEVLANGYRVVHEIETVDSAIDPRLLDAFHAADITVWYATFGNGTYATRDLPDGWEAWRMVTRSDLEGRPLRDGFTRLCLNNRAYRAWKKARIARTLREHPFDGIDIMEPHWPEYPGITSPAYACFCPECQASFRRMYPDEKRLPDILHADGPDSPTRLHGFGAASHRACAGQARHDRTALHETRGRFECAAFTLSPHAGHDHRGQARREHRPAHCRWYQARGERHAGVREISDDPALRLFHDHPPAVLKQQTVSWRLEP